MSKLYTAKATSTSGREGKVVTTDTKYLDLKVTKPGSSDGTNPEQLFACAYAACFGGAVTAVAKQHGKDVSNVEIKSEANLHKNDDGFHISATLDAQLPNMDQKAAEQIVLEAHEMCPYSKATRGNIDVQLKANGKDILSDGVSLKQAVGASS